MSLLDFFSVKKIDPQKTLDTFASGLDKAFYTKEEQSDDDKESIKAWSEWFKHALEENSERSITRRKLALIFSYVFLFLMLLSVAIYRIDFEYAKFIFEVAKTLGPYIGGIMTFFFGVHLLRQAVKK